MRQARTSTCLADPNGYFKAPLVPPGTYTVTISAKGFGTYNAKAVPVTVGSLTELHPGSTTGSTTETVEVSGVAPVLQFESPEVSSTLTTQEIVNLPLNGGRWSNLALLTPGAASDANGFGLISFRGISPILNNVEIDGADNNQAFFSEERGRTRAGYSTSQISIAEFQGKYGRIFRRVRPVCGWCSSTPSPRAERTSCTVRLISTIATMTGEP